MADEVRAKDGRAGVTAAGRGRARGDRGRVRSRSPPSTDVAAGEPGRGVCGVRSRSVSTPAKSFAAAAAIAVARTSVAAATPWPRRPRYRLQRRRHWVRVSGGHGAAPCRPGRRPLRSRPRQRRVGRGGRARAAAEVAVATAKAIKASDAALVVAAPAVAEAAVAETAATETEALGSHGRLVAEPEALAEVVCRWWQILLNGKLQTHTYLCIPFCCSNRRRQ